MRSTSLAAFLAALPSAMSVKLLASHYTGQIYTLDFNAQASTLTSTGSVGGCGRLPGWLEYYSSDNTVYCFDESWFGSGFIASYNISSSGALTQFQQAPTTGNDVHGLLYGGADGKGFVATAQYSPSTITTYKLPLSASTKVLQIEKFTLAQPGPNVRQDVPHPHETLLDPTGKFILVPDLGADLIRIFAIDAASGKLTQCGNGQASPGDGPRHGKFFTSSANQSILYTLNELGNSVSAWTVSYSSGNCISLALTQTLSTYAEGVTPGPTTKAAELHVRGNFLYAANRADQTFGSQQDSIATYTIDPATGKLAWLEAANAHAYYPRTFQINKAGDLVAVGGQTSSNVAILKRDVETGKLGEVVASLVVATPGRPGEEDGLSAVVWLE
ncbi:putative isomerase YbhE [Periconia macrospinosa]|uniref:Putative isomerase YbhE n=1 Tax=Periconia macrospinosa TaxID=97972 RepID=A0A2V1E0R6_9PLEO|nr:putative isomerase YbhE [Periconia macrospinosa]